MIKAYNTKLYGHTITTIKTVKQKTGISTNWFLGFVLESYQEGRQPSVLV